MMRLCCLGFVVVFGLVGCASTEEALVDKERRLQEAEQQNETLAGEVAELKGTNGLLRKQVDGTRNQCQELEGKLRSAEAENSRLEKLLSARKPADDKDPTPAPRKNLRLPNIRVSDPGVKVEPSASGDAMVIRVADVGTFLPGRSKLTDRGQALFKKVAAALRRTPGYRVLVEGHTDDTPLVKTRELYGDNLKLSISRALAVRAFLVKNGVPASSLSIAGHGAQVPLVAGKSDSARRKNRRVELRVFAAK